MLIVAFDCATTTGYCVLQDGKHIESGIFKSTKKRGEGNGALFLRFNGHVRDIMAQYTPDIIVCEQAHFRGGAATEICVGLQTRIQEMACLVGAVYIAIHTAELKKAIAGHGKASKADMIKCATELSGKVPCADNEADAMCLAYFAHKAYGAL